MAGPCTEMMTAGPLSRPTKMLQDARSARAEMLKLCIFVISLVEMLVGRNNGDPFFAAWHRPNCSNFFLPKFKRCSNKTSSVCVRFRPRLSKPFFPENFPGCIIKSGRPVLNKSEYRKILMCTQHARFVNVISAKLKIPLSSRTLVLSDRRAWLDNPKKPGEFHRNPDAFIISPLFVNKTIETERAVYGMPAHASLFGGMGIINFVLQPSTEALNELLDQLDSVFAYSRAYHKTFSEARGALVFRSGIWLVWCAEEHFCYKKILWNAQGASATVSNFFAEWPPVKILDRLLHRMDLQLCDHPVRCLGSGRLGTVFEVRRRGATASDRCMALKVVVGNENMRRLEREYETNREVCSRVKGIVVEAVSICKPVDFEGAGLLLREVGTRVNVTEPGSLLKALRALQRLHAAGYCHGSAREDNLLACGAVFKWCDLQRAEVHSSFFAALVENDVMSLLLSFNHQPLSLFERYVGEWDFSMEGLLLLVQLHGVSSAYLGEEDGSNTSDLKPAAVMTRMLPPAK